jgi:hypothetical protein
VKTSAVYYKSCNCGAAGTETFTHGSPLILDENQRAHLPTSLTVSIFDAQESVYGFTYNTELEPIDPVIEIKVAGEDVWREYVPTSYMASTHDEDDRTVSYYVSKAQIALSPDTVYVYRVCDRALDVATPEGTLRTGNAEKHSFTFAHVSDSQAGPTEFGRVMQSVSDNADFVIHTGDVVQYADYEHQWCEMLDGNFEYVMGMPIMAISGNHETSYNDASFETEKHFNNKIPEQESTELGYYYSFVYGDVKFIARSGGGHASAPGKNTPIPRLAKFISRVEKKNPFKVAFSPAVNAMFGCVVPYMNNFGLRLVMANLWLFRPLLKKIMPAISAQAAAMLQTTIAFTMQQGSAGYNVLPQEASVCANMRFIPHQGTDESIELITKLAEKHGLETEVIYRGYPSNSLDLEGEAFAITKAAIGRCFPGVGVMPYVVTGGTDARFYGEVCDSCVRFSPVNFGPEQMAGMHGLNENIEIGCLPGAVDYYKTVIRAQEGRK